MIYLTEVELNRNTIKKIQDYKLQCMDKWVIKNMMS